MASIDKEVTKCLSNDFAPGCKFSDVVKFAIICLTSIESKFLPCLGIERSEDAAFLSEKMNLQAWFRPVSCPHYFWGSGREQARQHGVVHVYFLTFQSQQTRKVHNNLLNPLRTAKPLQWLGCCLFITCRSTELESCLVFNPLKKQKVS